MNANHRCGLSPRPSSIPAWERIASSNVMLMMLVTQMFHNTATIRQHWQWFDNFLVRLAQGVRNDWKREKGRTDGRTKRAYNNKNRTRSFLFQPVFLLRTVAGVQSGMIARWTKLRLCTFWPFWAAGRVHRPCVYSSSNPANSTAATAAEQPI
jgi:hypothetical protein